MGNPLTAKQRGILGGLYSKCYKRAVKNFATDDLDETFARLQAADADIVQEPMQQPWGVRDCAVRDPAGTLIRVNEVGRDRS